MRVYLMMMFAAAGMLAAGSALAQAPAVKLNLDSRAITVLAQDQPVLTYCYGQVPFKPYGQVFTTPGGVNILRDSPEDHKHHHGLMFALAVDGVTFWGETEGCGTQRHRAFSDFRMNDLNNMSWASFTESLDWINRANEVLLTEQRTIEVTRSDALKASLIRWRTQLDLPPNKASAKLGGDHYYGLGMRFLKSMDEKHDFMLANDEKGVLVRGDEYVTPSAWCAYSAEADGKPVTVAMFDHPGNPRTPAKWFTMHTSFAYLAATLNLWKEPMELKAGQSLVMNYGIALWDGQVDKKTIAACYNEWLTWPTPDKEKQ